MLFRSIAFFLAVFCAPQLLAQPVTTVGAARSLDENFLGYNGNFARTGSWRDDRLVEAFASLHPGHIRYPAGTIANFWDWRTGWFKPGHDLPYGLNEAKPNPYRLEDLKRVCDATGVEPLVVLNLMTSSLEEQLAMLRAAQSLGLKIRRIELGNEFYLSSPDNVAAFPAAEDYARTANEWIQAIKAEFPEIKIAIVGAATRPTDDRRRTTWNDRVIPLVKGADAVVLHVYQGAGLSRRVDRVMEGAGLVSEPVKQTGSWGSTSMQREQRAAFLAPDGVARMIGMAFQRWPEFTERRLIPHGMEGWITEYNLFDRNGPVRGTWAHGLFTAVLTLSWLEDEKLTIATMHSLYGDTMFSAIHATARGFKGLLESEEPTVPYALAATGRALAVLGEGLRGVTQAQRLAFPVNPSITVPGVRDYPSLVGWKFDGPAGTHLFFLNVSDQEQTVPAGVGAIPSTGTLRQVWGDPHRLVVRKDSLEERAGPLSGKTLVLPPYSCTLLSADPTP